jgi:hypothetical protein
MEYKYTTHAQLRYKERINNKATHNDMIKDYISNLSYKLFKTVENGNCMFRQVYSKDYSKIYITSFDFKNIVTVYKISY